MLKYSDYILQWGSIPVIFSYFTEFQPKEKRGMIISALATFWMCGNIVAAGKNNTIIRLIPKLIQ